MHVSQIAGGGKGRLGSSDTTVKRKSLYRDQAEQTTTFPYRDIERESLSSSPKEPSEKSVHQTSTETQLPQSSAQTLEQVIEDNPRKQLELSVPQYIGLRCCSTCSKITSFYDEKHEDDDNPLSSPMHPVCPSKTSPCMPAPSAHVFQHVRVVPAHTGTFECTHGDVLIVSHHTTPHTQHNTTHEDRERRQRQREDKTKRGRRDKTRRGDKREETRDKR